MPFSKEIYCARRETLAKRMKRGVAIIPATSEKARNRDNDYPFRQDSYFYYLTGFSEPDAVLVVIAGKKTRSIIFVREKDSFAELWVGGRLGPKQAIKTLGVEEAYALSEINTYVIDFICEHQKVYTDFQGDKSWRKRVLKCIRKAYPIKEKFSCAVCDVRILLDEMRMIKAPEEIEVMRHAGEVSACGHMKAMQACKTGMMEYQLGAILASHFVHSGGDPLHAYPMIVAGGRNACTLHYMKNNCVLRDGDLVLIDAGCEFDGYAGDITRTFPVNGTFNDTQKEIYKIVLAAQLAAIEKIRPGNTYNDAHNEAVRVITQGLKNLEILKGETPRLRYNNAYERFFPHHTSHWLGLDVHDAGYYEHEGDWVPLKPGMVLTIEPGIYISHENKAVKKRWRGIGIRIEDDVLVTKEGCEVLTSSVPKLISEIEQLMR